MPDVWHGTVPPIPQCQQCKSVPENPYGPRIKMRNMHTRGRDGSPVRVTEAEFVEYLEKREQSGEAAKARQKIAKQLKKYGPSRIRGNK